MQEGVRSDRNPAALERELIRLKRAVVVLGLALVASIVWFTFRAPRLPPVLSVERLEIVEPDGALAFVLANSQRPVAATVDGQTLMEGQEEERRGVPSFVFFDGKGDEVGGLLTGVRVTDDGFSVTRHLSLDGYKQDQTVVLAHYQNATGSSAGLRISDRPQEVSLPEALHQLGLDLGASRAELQAALEALPEEGREARIRELFGVPRLFVGADRSRNASLVLQDGQGRPRILIQVPADGEPSIQILDEEGEPVLKLPS